MKKRKKMAKVALSYIRRFDELPPCRFDILSIWYKDSIPEFELIKDAFEV